MLDKTSASTRGPQHESRYWFHRCFDFEADDAKYVTFEFDQEVDTQLVAKYLVDLKK